MKKQKAKLPLLNTSGKAVQNEAKQIIFYLVVFLGIYLNRMGEGHDINEPCLVNSSQCLDTGQKGHVLVDCSSLQTLDF